MFASSKQQVVSAFEGGMICADIARMLGVSRQYVQQVISAAGLSVRDARAKQRAAQDERWRAEREAAFLKRHGIERDVYLRLRRDGLVLAFRNQRQSARARGIEWLFNFGQWYEVWLKSGHLHERGVGASSYCMARNGDSGPYAPWNVSIMTGQQNSSEGFSKPRKTKAVQGVFLIYPGTPRPWLARVAGERLGRFATEREAAAVVKQHRAAREAASAEA